jgi:hypothetical protein
MNLGKVGETLDTWLEKIKKPLYLWVVFLPYIAYLIAVLGIFYIDSSYIEWLKSIMQIAVALILLIRFNPLRTNHQLKEYDETIIFGSALILLTNATLTTSFVQYIQSKM